MPAPRDHNPRRAAVAKRLKAAAPAGRPVFRSGVDIDAVHYRWAARGIVASALVSRSPLEMAFGAAGAEQEPAA